MKLGSKKTFQVNMLPKLSQNYSMYKAIDRLNNSISNQPKSQI